VLRKTGLIVFLCILALGVASIALAAEEEAATGGLPAGAAAAIPIGAGIGIGIAAIGGALGQGISIRSALDGIARNPGASGKIVTPMIIGLAMIESLVIYSLLVSLLLLFKI
jgi:F-type H+-transporting ATPase subunit c